MITDAGKRLIKQYIAGQTPTIARTLALGIGNTAAAGTDKKLAFEIVRVPVTLPAYDPVADKIIFKASIPDEFIGTIYEIGLYNIDADTINDSPSQLLSSFDADTETWSGSPTWTTTYTRVGDNSLRLTAAASGTSAVAISTDLDLSNYSPTDGVILAFRPSANTSNVKVTFKTDGSNYYTGTISTPSAAYNVATINKSAFVATGTPDWSNITEIALSATATSGGGTTVDLDALSFVDQDFNNPDMVLVARQVLSTPFVKVQNTVNEIEFRMGVSVS